VLNAVDLTTVHRAKGLEWPAVFVPSVTAGRFPNTRAGRPQAWLVPRDQFDAVRYEGSDGDERRLFYVALTRARDWLSVSRHDMVTSDTAPSRYYRELAHLESSRTTSPRPLSRLATTATGTPSHLQRAGRIHRLGLAFRFRNLMGFQPGSPRTWLRQGGPPRDARCRGGHQASATYQLTDRRAARQQLLPPERAE
jgi:DNA helicase-2/ATP-dependent DNA helicase PcrA